MKGLTASPPQRSSPPAAQPVRELIYGMREYRSTSGVHGTLPACGRGCQLWRASRARQVRQPPVREQACYWWVSLSAPGKNPDKILQGDLRNLFQHTDIALILPICV